MELDQGQRFNGIDFRRGSKSSWQQSLKETTTKELCLLLVFFFYQQMEDDGFHGNDETRSFILSTLAAQKTSHVGCVLCHQLLPVFDRYPLIDGTFFLTPIQHTKNAISVSTSRLP